MTIADLASITTNEARLLNLDNHAFSLRLAVFFSCILLYYSARHCAQEWKCVIQGSVESNAAECKIENTKAMETKGA